MVMRHKSGLCRRRRIGQREGGLTATTWLGCWRHRKVAAATVERAEEHRGGEESKITNWLGMGS